MSKEIRMRDYERKESQRQGKSNKYFQAQEDYEMYVAPVKNMSIKELEFFMEKKFDKLIQKKPNLYNKFVQEIQGKILCMENDFKGDLYQSMKKFVGEHANRELTDQEIEEIKQLNYLKKIQNIAPPVFATITYSGDVTTHISISIGHQKSKKIIKVFYREADKDVVFIEPMAKRIKKDTLNILKKYNEMIQAVKDVPQN